MPLRRSYGAAAGLLERMAPAVGPAPLIRGGQMKPKRPSPAMIVALVALVMSMTGGAIAAVNFAQNAGSVDGYSAVKAKKAGKAKAAGKLVATYKDGSDNRGH